MVAVTITQITPDELEGLIEKSLRKIMAERQTVQAEADQLLNMEQAGELLHLAQTTIYGLVSRGTISHYKCGNRLWFSKQELLQWIKSGRKKTNDEDASQAFVTRKK